MAEPILESGVPDETWDENSRAQYKAIKLRILAELPDEPDWLDRPTVSMDEVMEELERLHAEAESREGTL